MNDLLLEAGDISFFDLFNLEDIQRLQDDFSKGTGVASIITRPDGTPLTAPSNFTDLCFQIIRKTDKGLVNCMKSDAALGAHQVGGPIVQPCLSGGLWDAGTAITVSGRHIANWLIGQVRDETQTEAKMRDYAQEIGVDEELFLEAFSRVPAMTRIRFEQIASLLYTLASQLSASAYQNLMQARLIAEGEKAQTEALMAKKKAQESEARYRALVTNSLEGIAILDLMGTIIFANQAVTSFLEIPTPELVFGRQVLEFIAPDSLATVAKDFENVAKGIDSYVSEYRCHALSGKEVWLESIGKVIVYEGNPAVILSLRNVTQRKQAEAEREKLQAQLSQAQKMESIGRLAGGVAHDFNNMLGVILGHAELAIEHLDPSLPLHVDIQEIRKAAERSADLTRQLLAFARKQTVAPRVLDLDETVSAMLKMLKRLIGEDIQLIWSPEKGLWPVRMDPSQLDQILANLCVNARDAIRDIGEITIEAANSLLDDRFCADHLGFVPGEYVRLSVRDNGCGMDEETMRHLFEPFFTTKGIGVGTGLGLATVYGAVKQNHGFIDAKSEPDVGTTMTIYLPPYLGKADLEGKAELLKVGNKGYETILLVEDEPAILKVATMMLERLGYEVMAASTPGQAMSLAREHAGDIHLLMTDVVMPEMNGRDLAKNLLSLYPKLSRLFMSGYTADVIAHHGVLDEGVHFMQKPFKMKVLADKVREALDCE